jgi:hypothetical protein
MKQLLRTKTYYLMLCLMALVAITFTGCGGGSGGNVQGQEPVNTSTVNAAGNNSPVIDNVISEWSSVERGKTTKVRVYAHDPDGDKLTYSWSCMRGTIAGKGVEVSYTAPTGYIDQNEIIVSVSDGRGGSQYSSVNIRVVCCAAAQKNPDWNKP